MCESSRNAFTCGRLDRLSNHRHEPSFVAEALQSPSAKFLAFHGLRPLLVAAGVSSPMLQPHWLALEELQRAVLHRDATRKFDLAPESHYVPSSGRHQVPGSSEHVAAALRPDYDAALHVDWTLLGSRAPGTDAREREFLFAVNVTKTCTDASEIESHVGGEPRARFADLRGAVVSLSREDASIIGQACDWPLAAGLLAVRVWLSASRAGSSACGARIANISEPNQGRGLLAWHEKETFCSSCRSPLMQANGGYVPIGGARVMPCHAMPCHTMPSESRICLTWHAAAPRGYAKARRAPPRLARSRSTFLARKTRSLSRSSRTRVASAACWGATRTFQQVCHKHTPTKHSERAGFPVSHMS